MRALFIGETMLRRAQSTLRGLAEATLAAAEASPTPAAPAAAAAAVPGPSSGWYSASSIESRLRTKRVRPAGQAAARSRPPPSEEDFYSAAGAPGYDGAAAAARAPAKASAAPPTLAAPAPAEPAAATGAAAAPAAAAPSYDIFSRRASDWPVVRTSAGAVSASSLPAFARAFQLRALPAYAASRGCLSAALWLGEVPLDAAPADVCASALAARAGAARGGGAGAGAAAAVPVTAVTAWASAEALEAATAAPPYVDAMATLSQFFLAPPRVTVVRKAAAWESNNGGKNGEGDSSKEV
jgi:hypothetical protein